MHLTPDIFSDIFTRRDNVFTRRDARLKMLVALITIGCVVLSKNPIFPSLVLLVCLSAILAVGIPPSLIAIRLASPLGLVGLLVILKSAFTSGTQLWHLDLSFGEMIFTKEGLLLGLLIGIRVLGAVSVVLLLSFVTPAHQIFRAMHWLRAPRGWVEIAILMYRYLFTLLDLVGDTTAAQKLRLGYRGLRRSLRSAGMVAGTIVLRSVDQAVRTHEAMILRGYQGILPFEPMPSLPYRESWVAGAVGILIVGFYVLCERSFA